MFATDPADNDATAQYQYALSHCREQNSAELFGGWVPYIPARLYDYRDRDLWDILSDRTDQRIDTKTFHRYLYNYIRSFVPEPINGKKNYLISINRQGEFKVILPGFEGEIHLSETEKRLFSYICFLNVAAQYVPYDHDHSYTSPERQLLWRLEDLDERYHELITQKTGRRDEGVCFSESDLRYVLPRQFLSVTDVRKAIELAVHDLAERYGIYVRSEPLEEVPEMDEITGMQISFLDVLSLQSQYAPLGAA